jgi:hypothetical protein
MREFIDIRLSESWAQKNLDPSWGAPMGHSDGMPAMTRQIVMPTNDPRVVELKKKMLVSAPGWMTILDVRTYEPSELQQAATLHLLITEYIDACGEDYGTVYDDSQACPRCGLGRKQISPLRLDIGKIPKKVDLATTIARGDELLVSQRLAELIRDSGVTGCRLDPVEHAGRMADANWYQLVVSVPVGITVAATRFGKDFFRDDDVSPESICTEHGLLGLNLLSEVFVDRNSIEAADIVKTFNRYGIRSGCVQPSAILLISQRFYRLMEEHRIRGFKVEVAHLV